MNMNKVKCLNGKVKSNKCLSCLKVVKDTNSSNQQPNARRLIGPGLLPAMCIPQTRTGFRIVVHVCKGLGG